MKNKKEENSTPMHDGLFLSCLCGNHKKDSKCEVYLRNNGKWVEHVEENLPICQFCKKYKIFTPNAPSCLKCFLK